MENYSVLLLLVHKGIRLKGLSTDKVAPWGREWFLWRWVVDGFCCRMIMVQYNPGEIVTLYFKKSSTATLKLLLWAECDIFFIIVLNFEMYQNV